jgi:hypothetical protein
VGKISIEFIGNCRFEKLDCELFFHQPLPHKKSLLGVELGHAVIQYVRSSLGLIRNYFNINLKIENIFVRGKLRGNSEEN